ncbi:formate dehydrogenase subunit gamma [Noviherbaspirillum massiliense]|uniref:formate dehydrogenase subunit gamma n=1 Tax=Noviherbaspirillum massiliense TaxID=1465823 RepID=UPI0002F5D3E7|nr:formate dehydrogenase subunit gamma [Noviherbaspirillum massiliense]
MDSLSFRQLLSVLLFALLIPVLAHAAVPNEDAVPAYAEEQTILQTEKNTPEPGWGDAASGRVHMDRHFLGQYGESEGNVILQRGGNTWRNLRNGPIATISGALMVLMLLGIVAFYRAVGPAPAPPESGRRVERFSSWDRIVHWATAISFLILAITGLIVMFGKKLLLPWMGHDVYSWLAIISKYLHNFFGPLFILCSVILFFTFLRKNIFERWDWQWIKKGGGLLSHEHVPAGYFNAGEKLWFWGGVTLLGLVMSISGLILDFVNFGQTRYILQWANYLHVAGATFYIIAAMGHIYIGTLGTPGAYHAMRHGTVDEEWARTHHPIWYEELRGGGSRPPPAGAFPEGTAPRRT